jgi:transcriptional regulator with AAA-type ATPase domain/transcriptional regulatory protein LevR
MRKDRVLEYIRMSGGKAPPEGFLANEVAEALGIWRNDVSVELNKLVCEGKLYRTGKKNIRYFPVGSDAECGDGIADDDCSKRKSAFSKLVGSNGSLKHQIRVAKAAVSYPRYGINMLITGSTGVGKSRFAQAVWEYAQENHGEEKGPVPFIVFNCAEYADNPQLLLSILFGHRKGSFTGAEIEKTGLVEEANGGILFLDEIHCLSSTGQELFFTLLDSGRFRRIGENIERESRFMLIGATTKLVTDALVETFLRRMPILIQIPTLSERPVSERVEFIEYFFSEETVHIGHSLLVKKEVLNALLDYTDYSNLGQLKNTIQISCAKGYMRHLALGDKKNEIQVSFSDLSFQAFQHTDRITDKPVYMTGRFLEDRLLSADRSHLNAPAQQAPVIIDIYDFVEKQLEAALKKGLNSESIQQLISLEVNNYHKDMDRLLRENDTDTGLLSSIILPGTIQISAEFLGNASKELSIVYSNTAPLLLAMHISQYVDRMRSEQPVFPLDFRKIVKGYLKELDFVQRNTSWLEKALHIKITADERDFLSIFLRQVPEKQRQPGVWITLVSSADDFAANLGRFASSIYHANHIHWVEHGVLGNNQEDLFQNVCDSISTYHGHRGNLILTDIGILKSLVQEITRATYVECAVIPLLDQHILLDAVKTTLASNLELADTHRRIMSSYRSFLSRLFHDIPLDDTEHQEGSLNTVIFTVCVTGSGSAKSIKDVLDRKLSFIPTLEIIPQSSLSDLKAEAAKYGSSLKLIVGTVNPEVPDVPFLSADRVFTPNGMYCISSILNEWGTVQMQDINAERLSKNELNNLLRENFHFFAPNLEKNTAVPCIELLAKTLENDYYNKSLPGDVWSRLFMHAAGMLERLENGGHQLELNADNRRLMREKSAWLQYLERVIRESFLPLGFEIPESEIFFFMLSLPESL